MKRDETDLSNQSMEDIPSLPLTREALYALVWKEPMTKVAAKYNVSSSYMARVCTSLNVPRPKRGYWATIAVGIILPIPPLPEAQPGDELVWSRDGQHIRVPIQPPIPVRKRTSKFMINPSDQHPLVNGAKELFEAGRLSYDSEYLKPWKKLLVDLVVTKTGLDQALDFANNLFLNLEGHGHSIVIAPKGHDYRRAVVDEHEIPKANRGYDSNNLWYPFRYTVVHIGTVAIGLTIIEMSEEAEARYINGKYVREKDYIPPKRNGYSSDYSWTTTKSFPSGRLRLQAYSPYPRTKWVKCWEEKKSGDLSKRIKGIIKELKQAAIVIPELVAEAERKFKLQQQEWEAQQEIWRREKEERRAAEALKESREELLEIIDCWAESNRIEQFFKDVEQRAADLNDTKKCRIHERLKLARDLIGSVDALDHFIDWRSPEER